MTEFTNAIPGFIVLIASVIVLWIVLTWIFVPFILLGIRRQAIMQVELLTDIRTILHREYQRHKQSETTDDPPT